MSDDTLFLESIHDLCKQSDNNNNEKNNRSNILMKKLYTGYDDKEYLKLIITSYIFEEMNYDLLSKVSVWLPINHEDYINGLLVILPHANIEQSDMLGMIKYLFAKLKTTGIMLSNSNIEQLKNECTHEVMNMVYSLM